MISLTQKQFVADKIAALTPFQRKWWSIKIRESLKHAIGCECRTCIEVAQFSK